MTGSSTVLEPSSDPGAGQAFQSDPVLAFRRREFVHRRTMFPILLSALGFFLFAALVVAAVIMFVRDWGVFGSEQIVVAVLGLFGLLMAIVLGARLLNPRTRSAWTEVRGDRRVNLTSSWFTAQGGDSEADEIHRTFTTGDMARFPRLHSGRSHQSVNVGLHIFGEGYPLYVTVWTHEGNGVRAWPLVPIRSQAAADWAKQLIVGRHGMHA